jgi:hypothetical protein
MNPRRVSSDWMPRAQSEQRSIVALHAGRIWLNAEQAIPPASGACQKPSFYRWNRPDRTNRSVSQSVNRSERNGSGSPAAAATTLQTASLNLNQAVPLALERRARLGDERLSRPTGRRPCSHPAPMVRKS